MELVRDPEGGWLMSAVHNRKVVAAQSYEDSPTAISFVGHLAWQWRGQDHAGTFAQLAEEIPDDHWLARGRKL